MKGRPPGVAPPADVLLLPSAPDMAAPGRRPHLPPMKLPHAELAHVDGAKLRDYLLSSHHVQGRSKARAFARLYFTDRTCDLLAGELLRVAVDGTVAERVLTIYGTKFVVDGRIRFAAGSAAVRTVWLHERSGRGPRLLTACVLGTGAS